MGVKSLWSLLDPVGRPVLLETMEGKAMAIDSSIWIYQFQATMRDKEGRGLVNAHVLGFLRRISKLLFYGIKPVFVFDGGAPALKRATIAERKNKKRGAAASHAQIAERLLAAQLRREALNHAETKSAGTSKGKGKIPQGPVTIDENTVYLEDIDDAVPRTPAKKRRQETEESPPSSKKKSRWHDHDPYKLPDVNMEDIVAKATRSIAPDPRLATEDELRAFIEEMRPEDFDVTSPAFRELPTEVQYEIIGDLRLKSRQTSYKRLQNMLKKTKTPLDFSKEQIKNLKQRNSLTQQLLITTDSIGKAHVSIPIRIASERNKQYLLIKNEGGEGGWVLGIRDEGTAAKPIEIDRVDDKGMENKKGLEGSDSDADMEEVQVSSNASFDPDLREYRRGQALAALAERYSPKKLAPLTKKVVRKPKTRPLFDPDEGEAPSAPAPDDFEDDLELSVAIQQSLEAEEELNLQMALEASRAQLPGPSRVGSTSTPERHSFTSISHRTSKGSLAADLGSDDEDMYTSPTRLETALSIANAGPSRRPLSHSHLPRATSSPQGITFGVPALLLSRQSVVPPDQEEANTISDEGDEDDMEEVPILIPDVPRATLTEATISMSHTSSPLPNPVGSDSDQDMEEVVATPMLSALQRSRVLPLNPPFTPPPSLPLQSERVTSSESVNVSLPLETNTLLTEISEAVITSTIQVGSPGNDSDHLAPPLAGEKYPGISGTLPQDNEISGSEDDDLNKWSRSPSPVAVSRGEEIISQEQPIDSWDAAQEMDPQAEEGEFARFMSQVKGKDLDVVRKEIDDEIRALNQQKKIAMRDSEDITQQMISQIMIMLRLFGIPYITAPMEAEAQCAELVSLGLVDGIITDDSDVFLFGGQRVLKNMFNQSKTVECFLLSDLERELGLDRDKLIRLAYLLGSDYTEGLPGVGPVVAMELLKEFPGQDGLHKFKYWWQKVQSGKDTAEDLQSRFRKRFKKRYKDLYLSNDWPNPAVRDAYYHPTVDESDEPFKWGLPDLDALRNFFNSELGWNQAKVDDLLLPIIHKMNKRGQGSAPNMQGNLVGFLGLQAGESHAPRKRQAYASKRLQQVVSDFRKEQARQSSSSTSPAADVDTSDDEASERPVKKRKKSAEGKGKGKELVAAERKKAPTRRGGKTARGAKAKRPSRKRTKSSSANEENDEDNTMLEIPGSPPPPLSVSLRPRPKPAYKGTAAAIDDDDE